MTLELVPDDCIEVEVRIEDEDRITVAIPWWYMRYLKWVCRNEDNDRPKERTSPSVRKR